MFMKCSALISLLTLTQIVAFSGLEEGIVALPIASETPLLQQVRDRFIFQFREITAKDDQPPVRQPGGNFGNGCPSVDIPLTALIPKLSHQALTAEEKPTFWFYIPYEDTTHLSGEFHLLDSNDEIIDHQEAIPLSSNNRLFAIQLSEGITLEKDQDYQWYFSIICNPQDGSQNLNVSGQLRRVTPNFDSQFVSMLSPEEQVISYGQDGLWYETLTLLLDALQGSHSAITKARLKTLLTEGELTELIPEILRPE